MFLGLMTKHHLVQIEPVAINAKFCVRESLSAGRTKSDAPARTTPHFITGALKTGQAALATARHLQSTEEDQTQRIRVCAALGHIPEMNRFDPNLACPYSLEDTLRLRGSALDSWVGGGPLMAAEDCLSCAGEGLFE